MFVLRDSEHFPQAQYLFLRQMLQRLDIEQFWDVYGNTLLMCFAAGKKHHSDDTATPNGPRSQNVLDVIVDIYGQVRLHDAQQTLEVDHVTQWSLEQLIPQVHHLVITYFSLLSQVYSGAAVVAALQAQILSTPTSSENNDQASPSSQQQSLLEALLQSEAVVENVESFRVIYDWIFCGCVQQISQTIDSTR